VIRRICKFILIIFCVYIGIWLVQNLDFISIFTKTGATLRYEFSKENIQQCLIRVEEIRKNHFE